ncbi:hypothetical protein A3770_20p84690 [Chloropicon primus]|uniref:Uncharacterized protein n=2 Tax=Chloropicon primus TaxID=1764295 RepID=A0A5B8N061_9CHLO|nr:hypothetical protein A3770_20p84690 [Chloropicon primus]|mmetsp:Transcript_8351/g.23882  ORF Transcript_8351/g.23882 Transcript_8351/m.23882 type:complete len:159 (+) Transcript_8351:250-726(+)|eukprot:QDZ25951.1 hypothetical protein A3770_20p84690 [Chloropicon primus]
MVRYKNRFLVADIHCDRTNASYLKDKLMLVTSTSSSKKGNQEEGLGPGRGVPLVAAALEKVVHSCFGVCHSGGILSSLQVRCYDKIWSAGDDDDEGEGKDGLAKCLRCVVRCDREHCRDVRAALCLITSLAGVRVAITVVKVKGSQRTLADEAKAKSS